jgi:O-antigen ligase
MIVLTGLAPLPLGSNRPFLWGLTALAIGVVLLIVTISSLRNRSDWAVPVRMITVQALLFGAFLMFLIFQVLPIGPLLGGLASAGLEGLNVVQRTLSISPGDTLLMLLRQLSYAAYFFLMLQVASSDVQRRKSLDFLLIIITAYAMIGIGSLRMGDTILGLEKWAYLGSATGTFVNRNSFATFLAFGAVLATTQLVDVIAQWGERKRGDGALRRFLPSIMVYAAALLLILAAVVSSQSRMGFVVTLCGMLAVLGLAVARNIRLLLGILVVVAVGGVAVVVVLMFYGEGLLVRLGALEKSAEVRVALYSQIIELISMRPWSGFGGGAFELAFPLVHQLPVSGDSVWDKAHSSYLALWSEMGLIFGSIPIILLALMARRMLKSLLTGKGSWRAQAVALGAITVGAVHSTVDFSLEIQANTIMFLGLIALGYATTLKSGREKST